MFYIRAIFSADYESKYIKLQVNESDGYADYVIVAEYNYTHTGQPRDFLFGRILEGDYFSDKEKNRIIYLPIDVSKEIYKPTDSSALTGEEMHLNEKLFRGAFVKHINLADDDIVLAVDADEIIFNRYYRELLAEMRRPGAGFNRKGSCFCLRLHQFYYRPDYLWTDCDFTAPTICFAARYKKNYPAQWRYEGKVLDKTYGCHFSWVMPVRDMVQKLKNYAHNDLYARLADEELLKKAIEEKKYPFDEQRAFTIHQVSPDTDKEFYPDCYGVIQDEMEEIIG